jgi:hypothetical protein
MDKNTIIAVLIGLIMVSGCISTDTQDQSADSDITDEVAIPEDIGETTEIFEEEEVEIASTYTAKEGYVDAEHQIKSIAPDAVFVGASGSADSQGKSESWTYYFDSLKKSKGYEVADGIVREKQFSFQDELTAWVDSSVAAEGCMAGEATLEQGIWTVSGDSGICEIDAITGDKNEK